MNKKKYQKPRTQAFRYALHGPCLNGKTYLIPAGDLGDPEPNCYPTPVFPGPGWKSDG